MYVKEAFLRTCKPRLPVMTSCEIPVNFFKATILKNTRGQLLISMVENRDPVLRPLGTFMTRLGDPGTLGQNRFIATTIVLIKI